MIHDRDEVRPKRRMRILLVSHEASRSGAPRIAMLSARSLVEQGHEVRLVSRYRGPLLEDFASAVPTSVEPLPRVRNRLRSIRAARPLGLVLETITALAMILRWRPDLVYLNSTAAAIYLRPARWLRRRTLLHVHESGVISERLLTAAHAPALADVTLIACSPSVQSELAALVDQPPDAVPMLPSVPDSAEVARRSLETPEVEFDPDEIVVGCCGSVEHRKGADLWVAAAREVRRILPDRKVRFVWVGDISDQPPTEPGDTMIDFIGPTGNPYAYMRRFDIATLPSRDDPFPLVVLESMLFGKPIVAFDVGGVSQQVGDGGIIVPAGDVNAFAQAVVSLIGDPGIRLRLGDAARTRAHDLYSTSAYEATLESLLPAG